MFPGFKALGSSTALSALNPGSALNSETLSLSYMGIFSTNSKGFEHLDIFIKKLNRIGENSIIFQLKPNFVTN